MFRDFQAERKIEPSSEVPRLGQVQLQKPGGRNQKPALGNIDPIHAEDIGNAEIGGRLQPSSRTTPDVQQTPRMHLGHDSRHHGARPILRVQVGRVVVIDLHNGGGNELIMMLRFRIDPVTKLKRFGDATGSPGPFTFLLGMEILLR